MLFYHHTIRIMTSRVNTNISSISVDDIAVLTMTVVDTGVWWGSRVGVGSLVASEMIKEGLQYKKNYTDVCNQWCQCSISKLSGKETT